MLKTVKERVHRLFLIASASHVDFQTTLKVLEKAILKLLEEKEDGKV